MGSAPEITLNYSLDKDVIVALDILNNAFSPHEHTEEKFGVIFTA